MTLNLNAENTRCDHHAHFTVLFQRELAVVRNFLADQTVISLDVFDFVCDLLLEGGTYKPFPFFFSVENWEVCVTFW